MEIETDGGEGKASAKWGLRSRAVTPAKGKAKVKWHERLVMELPKGKKCSTRHCSSPRGLKAVNQG